jgi:predicted ATPase
VEQELSMQLTLGVPLIATQGYAAPEVGIAYKRARELSVRLRETPDASEVLWGLWTFHTLRAEFETAREIAGELLRLGERLGEPGARMRGHWATEITYMHLGEFSLTLEHFAKALSFYDPSRHLEDGFLYALNPGVAMPCFAAWALWFVGQPEQALHRIEEALNSARALSEPISMAHSLVFAAILHQLRREPQMAQEYAEAAIGISGQHGLLMYQLMATIARGWALIQQGGPREAIVEMRQALAALETRDTILVRPHYLALVAESLTTAGQFEEGLPLLEEALALVESNGEGCYQAELYRLKGELIIRQTAGRGVARAAAAGKRVIEVASPGIASAERCFGESIKIARRQKAKSLELRTMTSLARMYQKQSKRQEARDWLANTYAQFTEGFDTADLHDAKALLDELS